MAVLFSTTFFLKCSSGLSYRATHAISHQHRKHGFLCRFPLQKCPYMNINYAYSLYFTVSNTGQQYETHEIIINNIEIWRNLALI